MRPLPPSGRRLSEPSSVSPAPTAPSTPSSWTTSRFGCLSVPVGSGFFKTTIQSNCFECKGAGEFLIDSCNFCNGNGVVLKNSTFNVIIPKNVDNGDFMRMVGIGDEHPKHDKGDIIIQVICSKTNNFEKSKYDLIYYLKLTLTELILLDDIEIPHPNGTIKINIPKNLDTDKPLRIFKKGYKINDHVGDFYIKLSIINNLSLTNDWGLSGLTKNRISLDTLAKKYNLEDLDFIKISELTKAFWANHFFIFLGIFLMCVSVIG